VATQLYSLYPPGPFDHVIPEAPSLDALLHANESLPESSEYDCPNIDRANICDTKTLGPRYFFDGEYLYLRLVDMVNYVDRYRNAGPRYDEFHGMRLTIINNLFTWRVRASCAPICPESPVCGVPVCISNTSYPEYQVPSAAVDFCSSRPGADVGCPTRDARKAFYDCFNSSTSGTLHNRLQTCRQVAVSTFTNRFGNASEAVDLADDLEAEVAASTNGGGSNGNGDASGDSGSGSDAMLIGAIAGGVAVALLVGVAVVIQTRKKRQSSNGAAAASSAGRGSRTRVSPSNSSIGSSTQSTSSMVSERPMESVWVQ
jgi:hypothetical protein